VTAVFLPQAIVFLLFFAGLGAMAMGARKLGLALIGPALFKWILLPIFAPNLDAGVFLPLLLCAPLVVIFGGLKLLQGGVNRVYGPRAGGYVAGRYLVRIFDGLGAAAWWLISSPFISIARAFQRGRNLRRW
jgi:hypothetical protein